MEKIVIVVSEFYPVNGGVANAILEFATKSLLSLWTIMLRTTKNIEALIFIE